MTSTIPPRKTTIPLVMLGCCKHARLESPCHIAHIDTPSKVSCILATSTPSKMSYTSTTETRHVLHIGKMSYTSTTDTQHVLHIGHRHTRCLTHRLRTHQARNVLHIHREMSYTTRQCLTHPPRNVLHIPRKMNYTLTKLDSKVDV